MTIFEAKQQFSLHLHFFSPASEKYVVYFLLQRDEIVYVGKSSDSRYLGRIRSHRKDKLFDSYAVATTNLTERQCLDFETSLISLIQPKYNKRDSYFSISRIINGINTYYDANNLQKTPAAEQEEKAAISFLKSGFFLALVWALFWFQSAMMVFFNTYNSMIGVYTMAVAVALTIYTWVKKRRFEKIRSRNQGLGLN